MGKRKLKLKKNKHFSFFIAGLGNPGEQYANTRHNAGFKIVELLSERFNVFYKKAWLKPYHFAVTENLLLVKPQTYMNHSGMVIPPIMKRFSFTEKQIIVIVDNMDLPPGKCRLKKGGSDAGHNGIKSIISETGSRDFLRLYIGVGRPETGVSVIDHVLGEFNQDDQEKIHSLGIQIAEEIFSLKEELDFSVLQGRLNGISV